MAMPAEGLPKLAEALAQVQAELPKLERDRTVEVEKKSGGTYTYSYVTLANLNDAILPLIAKHGLSFVAMPGAGSDGKMCVRYRLMHTSGEALEGEFPISGEGGIQMIGGRITYARRYCLAALVGVAADEDDESRLSEEGAPRTAQRAATKRTKPAAQQPAPAAEQSAEGRTVQRAQRQRAGRPPLPGEIEHAEAAERPPSEAKPTVAAGKVRQDQHRHMHALWRELGFPGDENREQRLTITARILGLSDLDTSADLTQEQADQVIAALRERKDALDRQRNRPVSDDEQAEGETP